MSTELTYRLSKFCVANNMNCSANYKIILAINGIKDAMEALELKDEWWKPKS